MMNKKQVALRLSQRTLALLDGLSEHHDMTKTAVLEMAVRQMAARDGVKPKLAPDAGSEKETDTQT